MCLTSAVDQSPLLYSVFCKLATERWSFTGSGSLCACAAELYGLESHSLSTVLGDVLAECQGKGFTAVLALGSVPGAHRT